MRPKIVPTKAVGRIPTLSLNILDTILIRKVKPVDTDPTNAEKEKHHS